MPGAYLSITWDTCAIEVAQEHVSIFMLPIFNIRDTCAIEVARERVSVFRLPIFTLKVAWEQNLVFPWKIGVIQVSPEHALGAQLSMTWDIRDYSVRLGGRFRIQAAWEHT